jgi:hypothetical protein
MWPSNSIPRYIPKTNENIYPHKNLHTNVYNSIIYNSQDTEISKMSSTNEWMSKMSSIHILEYYSLKKMRHWHALQRGWTLNALLPKWMKLSQKSSYYIIPFIWNVQSNSPSGDWCLPRSRRTGGKWGVTTSGYGTSFGGDENVLKYLRW